MNLSIQQFGDISLHAASVQAWQQTYCQLTRGALESSLLQLSGERFQIFRELINQRVVQSGEAPRGRICFAVPVAVPGPARVQGRAAGETHLFVLQGGDEFMFHMPMGMDLLAVTFDRNAFEAAVAETSHPDEVHAMLRQPVLQVSTAKLGQARSRLLNLFERVLMTDHISAAETEQCLESMLLSEMIDLLTSPDCDKRQRKGSSPGSYVVEKCHRLTIEERFNPLTVNDLCQRLRVSRRAMQNGFRSVADTTPINYIRCVRLNGARRELMCTRGAEVSIGDAASRWGFFHLSHFAADYQDLFGELPSQTRRADGFVGRPGPARARACADSVHRRGGAAQLQS